MRGSDIQKRKTPTLRNLQRKITLPIKRIRKIATVLKKELRIEKDFSIIFVDDRKIRSLNKKFLKRDSPTDVLSFPFREKDFLGEVVLSVEAAKRNSSLYNTSFFYELNLYMIHGLLHLLGFNDRRASQRCKMQRVENKILNGLKIKSKPLC